MFDSTLASYAVVIDSTSGKSNSYGPRLGGLIPYLADSTFFVDPSTLSMLLIDPRGTVARVVAVPRANDGNYLVGGPYGTPGFDARGRLVYRAQARVAGARSTALEASVVTTQPDSAPIVRYDMISRRMDTIAMFKIPRLNSMVVHLESGATTLATIYSPVVQTDDWTLLPDGGLGVVRGRDFHIDWLDVDGKQASGPKLTFDWKRIDEGRKTALLDSTQASFEQARADFIARGGSQRPPPPIFVVAPSEVPDYWPPFGPGSTRADYDGNVWIRTTTFVGESAVYYVANRRDGLVDRIQFPPYRVLIGFGPDGIVYMAVKDGDGARLERARKP